MDHYALCLSYHSNTKQSCLQPFWATTRGRLLGPKMALAISLKGMLPHRESIQDFATFWLLSRHSTNWAASPPRSVTTCL